MSQTTTANVAQRLASSASQVMASIDAIRNTRALMLLFATLGIAALAMGLGVSLTSTSAIFPLLFGLLATVVAFYGVNACGILLMDETKDVRTTAREAVLRSLFSSHRLLLLMLLVGAIYVAGALALMLVFLVCNIPFVGPLLYTVAFPLSVLLCGVAFLALFLVVMPLAAPAVWSGATTMQAFVHLFAMARRKLPQVVLLMLLLSLVCAVIGGLLIGVLLYGTVIAGGLSTAVLSGRGGLTGGGILGLMGGHGSSYAMAAVVGGGVLYAIVLSLPALIYVRGCCAVYLANIGDVDTDSMEQQMKARMTATREKAQAQLDAARAAAAKATTATQAPAPSPEAEAQTQTQPPQQTLSRQDEPAARACPACTAPHQDDDSFCGNCGARLGAAS